jgi:hypothetical protein
MTHALAIGPRAGSETRPVAAAASWVVPVVVGWLVIYGALILLGWSVIANLEFRDPDDELRLQQVRDLLAGQGWFDLTQYRIDAASGGVAMHWSRLVDAPVAAVILLARPLLGPGGAELAALLVVPGLTLLSIAAVVGWMASRTLPRGAVWCSVLALAFAAPVVVQVLPLRIDHHAWQITCALLAMAAFLDGNERRGGWLTGGALAAWMAISFEGLPLSAWFIALLALGALYDASLRARLVAAIQALAVVSAGLFLATRGVADLANHCDAIAPVHMAMFGWGAVAISASAALWPRSRLALALGLAVAGTGALAMIALAAPQCATGTFDMLDPVVRSFWYERVMEGKPIWQSPAHIIAQHTLPPLIGLFSAIALARRSQGPLARFWLFYALVLAGALVLGIAVARAAAIPGALAAVPLGWRIHAWLTGLKRPDNSMLRLGELVGAAALIFLALLPVIPALAIERVVHGPSDPTRYEKELALSCSTAKAAKALAALPRANALAALDFGPNIMLNSDIGVMATGHHRGATAMRQVIDAFSGTPEDARRIIRANGLRYVIVCPDVQEMDLYRKRAPDGFAVRLLDERAPAWLRPVPLPAASGLKMWEAVE